MKLANHLSIKLSTSLLIIMLIWSIIYFFMQMHEIYDDIDEGLTNLKQEFILQSNSQPGFIDAMQKYDPINMNVKEISYEEAINIKEEHITSKVYFKTEEEYEGVRLLKTAFRCDNNNKYYQIEFFTSTVETDDLIENMLTLLILLWVTLGALVFIANKIIIKRSARPFNQLLDDLDSFNLNRTEMINFPRTNISEFQKLNKTIRSLLEENIKVYNEQKTFIENASHELQTPISIASAKVELMMNDGSITENQITELGAILSCLGRIKKLNTSLLLLSKIKNKQFIAKTQIDLSLIINENLELFDDLIKYKELEVHVDIKSLPLLEINSDLAHIMITNLLKNAIGYNIHGGNIYITLTKDSLTISNDGTPINKDINIFDRYASGSSMNSSSGLGLSIVSSIVELYHFRITYTYYNIHQIKITFR